MSIQSLILAARRKAQDKYNTVKSRRAYEQQYPDQARKELAAQQKLQASRQALKEEKRAAFKARIGRIAAAVSGPTQRAAARKQTRPTINPAFDSSPSSGNIFTRQNVFTIGRQAEPRRPKKSRTIVIKL